MNACCDLADSSSKGIVILSKCWTSPADVDVGVSVVVGDISISRAGRILGTSSYATEAIAPNTAYMAAIIHVGLV